MPSSGFSKLRFQIWPSFEPKRMFLGRVAQCVGISIGVLHCRASI